MQCWWQPSETNSNAILQPGSGRWRRCMGITLHSLATLSISSSSSMRSWLGSVGMCSATRQQCRVDSSAGSTAEAGVHGDTYALSNTIWDQAAEAAERLGGWSASAMSRCAELWKWHLHVNHPGCPMLPDIPNNLLHCRMAWCFRAGLEATHCTVHFACQSVKQ